MKTTISLWGTAVVLATTVLITGCHGSGARSAGAAGGGEKPAVNKVTQRTAAPKGVDTSSPVATYSAGLGDEVTNNDFIVRLYPTVEQNVFQARIRYGGNEVSQDITMIPREYYRRIVLRKGDEDGTCVLGFEDSDGKFNEMKLITGSGTQIGVKTLKEYYLSNQ